MENMIMKIKKRKDPIRRFDMSSAEFCSIQHDDGTEFYGLVDAKGEYVCIGHINEETGGATFYEPRAAIQDCEMEDYEYRIWIVPLEKHEECLNEIFKGLGNFGVVKRLPGTADPLLMFANSEDIFKKHGGETFPFMPHCDYLEFVLEQQNG